LLIDKNKLDPFCIGGAISMEFPQH